MIPKILRYTQNPMEDYKSILKTKLAQAQDTLNQLKSFNLDEKIDRYNQLKAEMASLKTEIEQSLGIDLDQETKKLSKSKKPKKKIDEVALHASIVDRNRDSIQIRKNGYWTHRSLSIFKSELNLEEWSKFQEDWWETKNHLAFESRIGLSK